MTTRHPSRPVVAGITRCPHGAPIWACNDPDLQEQEHPSAPCRVCGTTTPEAVYSHDGQAHDDAGAAAYERDRAKRERGYAERQQDAIRSRCTCDDGEREPWERHGPECSLQNSGWAT